MKIKHPSKPIELRATEHGVILFFSEKPACNLADARLVAPNDEQIKELTAKGMKPADFKAVQRADGSRPRVLLSPDPAAWVEANLPALLAEHATLAAKRKAEDAAHAAARAAADAPHLEEMQKKIEAIRAAIPPDCVEVSVVHEGNFDGYPTLNFSYAGTPLHLVHDNVTTRGAFAIRPGALGHFAEVWVAWAKPADIEAAKKREAEKLEKTLANRAQNEERKSRKVPLAVVDAYIKCQGDPERLPDDIDNPSYWLVKDWSDAIEHQGLANPATYAKFAREMREAAREQPMDE